MLLSPARAFVAAAPAVLRPRDLYLPPALRLPEEHRFVINPRDWGPAFIDQYMAREWDGRRARMILPGIGAAILGFIDGGAYVRLVFSTPGAATWTVNVGFNPGANQIEGIGAGGDGAQGLRGAQPGGGGQYASASNVPLTALSSVPYQVGLRGAGGTGLTPPGAPGSPSGGDTWFNNSSSTLYAQSGTNGQGSVLGGVGGGHAAIPGNTVHNGGNGGGQVNVPGPGGSGGNAGGAAGGPNGAGANGGTLDGRGSAPLVGGSAGAANGGSTGSTNPSSSVAGNGGNNRSGIGGGVGGNGLHVPGGAGTVGGGGAGGGEAAPGGAGGMEDVFDGYGPGGGGGGGGNSFFNGPDANGGNAGGYGGAGGGCGFGTAPNGGLGTSGLLSLKWIP